MIEYGKLTGHLLYELGPIDDCKNKEDFTNWRQEISEFLWSIGAGALNPVNKPIPNSNEDEEWRNKLKRWKLDGRYDLLSKEMKRVVSQDLHLLDISSAGILYIDSDIHMCGSYTEASYICLEKKPLIIFAKNSINSIPNWLYGLAHYELFFNTISEVKDYILKIHRGQPAPLTERWKFLDIDKIFGVTNE